MSARFGAAMRVALLPSLIAPVREGVCFGGAEMAALALAEGLVETGHEVTLIGLPGSGGRGLATWIVPEGTPILRPGQEPTVGAGVDPFPELFRGLSARVLRGELDVLHLHLIDASALFEADRLARRHAALRVVSTLHLAAVFPETASAVQALLRDRSPVSFTAPSSFAARSYGPGSERILVVDNGVDVEALVPDLAALPRMRLAWAGRRSREKGLAAALEIARRAGRPIRIAGAEAPERVEVPEASSGPSPPAVEDLGLLPRSLVPEAVFAGALATLVTSSIAESHSLVAIESLAVGTPVVAFGVGALAEVVEDGVTGFVVPPDDVDRALWAVEAVASGAISRVRCRERAVARFDHRRTVARFEAIYALARGVSLP